MFQILPQIILIVSLAVIVLIVLRRVPDVTVREDNGNISLPPMPWRVRMLVLARRVWAWLGLMAKNLGKIIMEAKDHTARAHYLERFSQVLRLKNIKSQFDLVKQSGLGLNRRRSVKIGEEAERAFIKIIEGDPTNHEAYEGLGKLYLDSKKYKDALEVYEYLVKLHPSKDQYWSTLGLVHFNLGDFDAAISAYSRAIELRPDVPNRLINLGLSYEAKGQLAEALDATQRALKIAPNNPQYLLLLADLLTKDHKIQQAEEVLEKVLELEPTNPLAREKLMALKY